MPIGCGMLRGYPWAGDCGLNRTQAPRPWHRSLSRADREAMELRCRGHAAAGYGGMELGPYGYVPLDLAVVSEALTSRGLSDAIAQHICDKISTTARAALLEILR